MKIAIPAIQTYHELVTLWKTPVVCQLQEIWGRVSESEQLNFGEAFYRRLLTDHDELLDYFSRTDMDSLVAHFGMTVDLIVMNVHSLGPATNIFRKNLDRLGEIHRMMNIPTYAYALMEGTILDVFQPIFDKEEKDTRDAASPASAKLLRYALSKLFNEVGSIVYYPMLRQEKLLAAAHEFYEQVKEELGWSDAVLEQRMHEIETEIASKGSYTQTSEDLETGARLAWRNSAKCIGELSHETRSIGYTVS